MSDERGYIYNSKMFVHMDLMYVMTSTYIFLMNVTLMFVVKYYSSLCQVYV